jgi:hypothetical protein
MHFRRAASQVAAIAISLIVVSIVAFGAYGIVSMDRTPTGGTTESTNSANLGVTQTTLTCFANMTSYPCSQPPLMREEQTGNSTNQTLGLEMFASLNATALNQGQGVNVSISVLNLLSTMNNVSTRIEWGLPALPASFPCPRPMLSIVARGYYDLANVSKADFLPTFPPGYSLSCPAIWAYSPSNYTVDFLPRSVGTYNTSFYGNSNYSYPMSTFQAFGGYYSTTEKVPEGPNGTLFPALLTFSPGVYTVAAGDMWGQLVILHFTVEPNPMTTTAYNTTTTGKSGLYFLSFNQTAVCGPGSSLYGDYFIPWSVTLTGGSSYSITKAQPPNSNPSNGFTSTKNDSYSSISFSVPDGTYNYTIDPINDFENAQTYASSGTITINGDNVTVYVRVNLASCGSTITTTTFTSNATSTYTSQQGWTQGGVASLVLTSPKVLSYVKPAYTYDLNIVQDPFATNLANALINVTETQSVSGNWTGGGYEVTYSGVMLNATVQFTSPNSYQLISVGVTNLPNRTYSISYNSQQQHIIQVALSNTTVESLVSNFTKYYVNEVNGLVGNGTGSYYLSIPQVDGPKAVSVTVNAAMTAVTSATIGYNGGSICFYNPYFCYTVPWNSTG